MHSHVKIQILGIISVQWRLKQNIYCGKRHIATNPPRTTPPHCSTLALPFYNLLKQFLKSSFLKVFRRCDQKCSECCTFCEHCYWVSSIGKSGSSNAYHVFLSTWLSGPAAVWFPVISRSQKNREKSTTRIDSGHWGNHNSPKKHSLKRTPKIQRKDMLGYTWKSTRMISRKDIRDTF